MRRPVIRPLMVPSNGTPAGPLVSALVHVLIGVAVVGGSIAGTAVLQSWDELPEGLRFLVPPSTVRPSATRDVSFNAGAGDGGTSTAQVESDFGARRAGSADGHDSGGSDGSGALGELTHGNVPPGTG